MKYLIILSILAFAGCSKPKYDCMRNYYAGLDIEFCGPTIKCTSSEDETGRFTICRDTRSEK